MIGDEVTCNDTVRLSCVAVSPQTSGLMDASGDDAWFSRGVSVLAGDVDGVCLPVDPVDRVMAQSQCHRVRQRAAAASDDRAPVSAVEASRLHVLEFHVSPVDASLCEVECQAVGPVQVRVDQGST